MITFKIDVNIDITLYTLRDMVAVDHSVKLPQTSTRPHNTQEKTSLVGFKTGLIHILINHMLWQNFDQKASKLFTWTV